MKGNFQWLKAKHSIYAQTAATKAQNGWVNAPAVINGIHL